MTAGTKKCPLGDLRPDTRPAQCLSLRRDSPFSTLSHTPGPHQRLHSLARGLVRNLPLGALFVPLPSLIQIASCDRGKRARIQNSRCLTSDSLMPQASQGCTHCVHLQEGCTVCGEVTFTPRTPLGASFSLDHSLIPPRHYTQAQERAQSPA